MSDIRPRRRTTDTARRSRVGRSTVEHVLAVLVLPLVLLSALDAGRPWDQIGAAALLAVWVAIAAGLALMVARTGRPRMADWLPEAAVLLLVGALMITGGGPGWALLLVGPLHLLRVRWLIPRLHTATGRRHGVVLASAALIGFGTAFSILEHRSVDDGLWWALSTMTTVGYGDVVPATTAGRLLGVAAMFVGIGLLMSVVTGVARTLEATAEQSQADAAVLDELRRLHERLDRLERLGTSALQAGSKRDTPHPSRDAPN